MLLTLLADVHYRIIIQEMPRIANLALFIRVTGEAIFFAGLAEEAGVGGGVVIFTTLAVGLFFCWDVGGG